MNAHLTLHPGPNTRWLFFRCRAPRSPGQLALQLSDLGILAGIAGYNLRQLPLPRIQRVLADTRPLGNLGYRISALGGLGHRLTLELIAEIGFPHHRLLSSKSGSKASRNVGAIHTGWKQKSA